jgi:hypothetical protein
MPTNRFTEWTATQLHLNHLYAEINASGVSHRSILVEAQGNGLHVPWCGILAESRACPDAVVVSDISVDAALTSPLPRDAAQVLALNCFEKDDDAYFRQITQHLGAIEIRCSDPLEFREAIQAHPYRLIIVGGHGGQDVALGKLRLQIGSKTYDALEVWHSIKLPEASIVVGFTCFGAAGESAATREFGSIASLALRAGARAAVASRWPAWIQANTVAHYKELFSALAASASNPDWWRVGADVMRFVLAMRDKGLWNSLGWGVYVPRI